MQERRMFERIEAPMKIKYEIIEQTPSLKTATSKDISGTGIRLALDEKLNNGTNLKLEVNIPNEKDKVATIYGKVVWSRGIEVTSGVKSSNYYETGIEFTKADPLTIGKIFKHFQKKE